MQKRGKKKEKKGEREKRGLDSKASSAREERAQAGRRMRRRPGQGHRAPWTKAVSPSPGGGQEGRTPTARSEDGGGQREGGQQVSCAAGAPWMELDGLCGHSPTAQRPRTALPPRAAASPVPTPLAEEASALLCTPKAPAKGGREFSWGALHERRGMSSPMVAATPSVCQAPAETAV